MIISIHGVKNRVHALTGKKVETQACVKLAEIVEIIVDNLIQDALSFHIRLNEIRRTQKVREKVILDSEAVEAAVNHINNLMVHPLSSVMCDGGGDTKTQYSDIKHLQCEVRP